MLRECALLCVSTAQDIISTLLRHQTVDGTVGLLPAWWYRVYYVYTAATVLIAAKLRPDVFSRADLGRSWGEAMAVLGRHERFGQSARRCTAALHFLASKMGQEDATEGYEDGNVEQVQCADFVSDLSFDNVDFDANSLSWLNDMHGTWELLNQA